jgi:hypothetical protein
MKNIFVGAIITIGLSGGWCSMVLACVDDPGLHVSTNKNKSPVVLARDCKHAPTAHMAGKSADALLKPIENMPMLSLLDMARVVSTLPSD